MSRDIGITLWYAVCFFRGFILPNKFPVLLTLQRSIRHLFIQRFLRNSFFGVEVVGDVLVLITSCATSFVCLLFDKLIYPFRSNLFQPQLFTP